MLTWGRSVRLRTSATTKPTARPIATPADGGEDEVAGPRRASEKLPPTTAATATRKATRAVASLNRPSPSTTLTSRRGTSSLRMIIAPASGSVGETIAPSANAAAQDMPAMSSCATSATAHIVTSTRPMLVIEIGRRFARRSPRLAKKAAL